MAPKGGRGGGGGSSKGGSSISIQSCDSDAFSSSIAQAALGLYAMDIFFFLIFLFVFCSFRKRKPASKVLLRWRLLGFAILFKFFQNVLALAFYAAVNCSTLTFERYYQARIAVEWLGTLGDILVLALVMFPFYTAICENRGKERRSGIKIINWAMFGVVALLLVVSTAVDSYIGSDQIHNALGSDPDPILYVAIKLSFAAYLLYWIASVVASVLLLVSARNASGKGLKFWLIGLIIMFFMFGVFLTAIQGISVASINSLVRVADGARIALNYMIHIFQIGVFVCLLALAGNHALVVGASSIPTEAPVVQQTPVQQTPVYNTPQPYVHQNGHTPNSQGFSPPPQQDQYVYKSDSTVQHQSWAPQAPQYGQPPMGYTGTPPPPHPPQNYHYTQPH